MAFLKPEELAELFPPMRPHREQARLATSEARFDVVPAGRRSGKTEIVGKRRFVLRAVAGSSFPNPRYFVSAPTRDQTRRIYWEDLKKLTEPFRHPKKQVSESRLIIPLITGAEIHLLGMDKPERIEGSPWDGGVLDEYGNMKKETWGEHVRPALSDRNGWCSFIGVPEGRNHYYELYRKAKNRKAKAKELGISSPWDTFHWISADILPPEEIEEAKLDLDDLTFKQEYEADFVNFTGRTYYNFFEETHCGNIFQYYSRVQPIAFCFDFNIAPGTATVIQEMNALDEKTRVPLVNRKMTGVIGEVYIPRNSNTVMVCNKLIKMFGSHEGRVYCYGDATGGSGGTAKLKGSDWELIKQTLHPVFGSRLRFRVKRQNPRERARVNAVNSRCRNIAGQINLMVDGAKCPYTVRDFEGVKCVEGGSGEIDKKDNKELTHITDGIGYYCDREYPVKGKGSFTQQDI